jgi:hypothetical protein
VTRLVLIAASAAALACAPARAAQAPASVAAAPSPLESPADPVRIEKARKLAGATEPFDILMALNLAGWEAAVSKSLALDPGVAKLEQAYPGVSKAGIEAARSFARTFCEDFVKRNIELKAGLYARRMTAGELDDALAFWSTDFGKSFVRKAYGNYDSRDIGSQAAEAANRTGKTSLSAEAVAQADRLAMRKTAEQTTASDQVALMRFASTEAGRKYAAARAEAEPLLLQMINGTDPAQQRKQFELIQAGMLAFIDSRKAK